MVKLASDWQDILAKEFEQDYYLKLRNFLMGEYSCAAVYPSEDKLLAAFELTAYHDTKVVILGQDPYHGAGQAHGLCFSVADNTKLPPSLVNIFKELYSDCGIKRTNGDLTDWARQGVLLLNTVLSVRQGSPSSHKGKGWETFTDNIIRKLSQRESPLIFLLWGDNARCKKVIIGDKHTILEAPHPSPLSSYRGFFGCKHFSKTNEILSINGKEPINW